MAGAANAKRCHHLHDSVSLTYIKCIKKKKEFHSFWLISRMLRRKAVLKM